LYYSLQAKRSIGDLQRMLRDAERDAAAAEERVRALEEQHAVLAGEQEAAGGSCGELQGRQEDLRRRVAAAAAERCVCVQPGNS
jgi:predicted  nucleic acid-binding Zn-ribbon protein